MGKLGILGDKRKNAMNNRKLKKQQQKKTPKFSIFREMKRYYIHETWITCLQKGAIKEDGPTPRNTHGWMMDG